MLFLFPTSRHTGARTKTQPTSLPPVRVQESSMNLNENESKVRVIVFGCLGRMGRRLCVLAASGEFGVELVGAVEGKGHPSVGRRLRDVETQLADSCNLLVEDDMATAVTAADVVIDFSSRRGTYELAERLAATAAAADSSAAPTAALVTGTTGLSEEEQKCVDRCATRVAVLQAKNFSVGVNLMFHLAGKVASALGTDFDIQITEVHHNKKLDKPSGTAIALVDSICTAAAEREAAGIDVHSLRVGGVVGDHTVTFGSEFERLEITHRADNRDAFVVGALRAAVWLACRRSQPRKYTMEDVISSRIMM